MSKIIWRLPSDAATLTPSSENADYPVENTQASNLQPPWRTDDANGLWEAWIADLGASYMVGAMAILGNTIAEGDTLQIQANSINDFAPAAIIETITSSAVAGADVLYYLDTPSAYRWWRFIDLFDASGGAVFDVGRLFVGTVYDLERGPAPGSLEWGRVDTGSVQRVLGGQVFSDVGESLKTMRCKLSGVNKTDSDELDALQQQMGGHTPFIFHPQPIARPDEWIYGILKRLRPRKDKAFGNYWDWDIDMVEVK